MAFHVMGVLGNLVMSGYLLCIALPDFYERFHLLDTSLILRGVPLNSSSTLKQSEYECTLLFFFQQVHLTENQAVTYKIYFLIQTPKYLLLLGRI